MGDDAVQIPRKVGDLVRSLQQASDARDTLGLTIGVDVLAPNGDGSQLTNLPPGPPGPAGDGDLHFVFTQSSASATWNIAHNLGKYPSVTVIDSGNDTVVGGVTYVDTNNVTLTFSAAFSGKAYLN